jgi:Raf kinase inhibitor-like YbhB/YbcL family protein
MGVAQDVMYKLGRAFGGGRAGAAKLVSRRLGGDRVVVVTSPDFGDGEPLPISATADGEGGPPVIQWQSAPADTQSIVLVCEDPDAPLPEPFVHWLVYAIPASAMMLDTATLAGAREGKSSALRIGYAPAAPPRGHGVHHYHFQVFALDEIVHLADGAGRRELVETMNGHVLGWGEIVGTYERK